VAERFDSPDETKLGFERIYTVTPEATAPQVLLEAQRDMYSSEHFDALSWAPDGTRITVIGQSYRRAPNFTLNAHGGARRALPVDPILTTSAGWAPDGILLAYTTGDELKVVDSRTNEDQMIWSSRRGSGRNLVFGRLVWSPAGEVVTLTGRSGAEGRRVLRWFDVSTGESHTQPLSIENASDALLSPDGTAVAVLPASATDCSRGLTIVNLSTGHSHRVTDQCVTPGAFDWSPDSTQLVFANFAGDLSEEAVLWSVRATGGAPTAVLTAGSIGADRVNGVAWQPVPLSQ